MRHRSEPGQDSQTQGTEQGAEGSTLQRPSETRGLPGRHRAPGAFPRVPEQTQPRHDTVFQVPVPAPRAPEPDVAPEAVPEAVEEGVTPEGVETLEPAATPEHTIPLTAHWRASHLPRTIAATLLGASVVGTAGLAVRYTSSHTSDNFVSLAVGLVVVVALWAVMIASTPQVVSLNGSVLTVHNTSGSELFDLVDALQPVDLVGNPRTSYWAVLLHRPNGTTQVLRHHDVNAVELDAIVRHYRNVAGQRFADREARFNLKRARPIQP